MSWHLLSLVYKKKAGSHVRKSILAYCADKASDDGSGIWASKATIAAEIECGRSTVIRTFKEFVEEGLLVVTGTRPCANGETVVYAIREAAVKALPDVEKPVSNRAKSTTPVPERDRCQSEPVPERDPTRPAAGPHPSQSGTQTTLEPPLNLDTPLVPQPKKPDKARLPENWAPSDEDREYALSLNLTDAEIEEIADDFHAYWTDRTDAQGRKSQRGWRQAWRNRCRDVAPKFIRNRRMAGQAYSGGYGSGGGLAGAVARRQFGG